MDILNTIDLHVTELINNVGILAPLIASLLICVESMFPILPLAVFITFNFYYFGLFWGFIISWLLTCLGCYIAFKLARKKIKFWFDSKIMVKHELKLTRWMMIVNHLKLEQLVLLIVIPFTPAFMINLVAGVSGMSEKKYVTAIIIGKIFLVYFWGFVGTSLIDSFKNPSQLVIIGLLMITGFTVSKIVNKNLGIE